MSVPQQIIFWSLFTLGIFSAFHAAIIFSADSSNPHEVVNFDSTEIKIGGHRMSVELAKTNKQQERGLSYRKSLTENKGMLFIFNQSGKPGFWMKDMDFAIDIIWIDQNKNIVFIDKKLSPASYPKIFNSPLPIKYVLEIKTGETDRLKLKVGDHLKFKHGWFWY